MPASSLMPECYQIVLVDRLSKEGKVVDSGVMPVSGVWASGVGKGPIA